MDPSLQEDGGFLRSAAAATTGTGRDNSGGTTAEVLRRLRFSAQLPGELPTGKVLFIRLRGTRSPFIGLRSLYLLVFSPSPDQCNPVQQQPRSSGVGAGKGKLNIPEEVRDAIARVHRDDHENVWTVIGYVHRDGFEVLAEGAGEVVTDTVLENMPDDNISLALIRVVDYVDNHPTVKFVFIQSMPDTVSVMKRSRVATQKNLIHPIFEPYHVMFEISEKSDINHEILMDKVQAASGTKKWEVEKRD